MSGSQQSARIQHAAVVRCNATFLVGMPPAVLALNRPADDRGARRSQMRRGSQKQMTAAKCVAPRAMLAQSFPRRDLWQRTG